MSTLVQRSFSGGEIAPSLYARVDTAKYSSGLRTCRNFMIMRHGGAQNRPGTKFVCEVKDSTKTVRLIPFVFNSDQTYVLEFGDQYMRVIKDGEPVRLTAQNITNITQANPAVVTYSGSDSYANGDHVYISGVVGMTQVNNRTFKVANVNAGLNTFELQSTSGSNINSTSYTAYSSGGTVEEVYEIATPYVEADLSTLQYVQSADVITIVHQNYAPRDLSRLGDANWTLSTISFEPEIAAPTNIAGTPSTAGSEEYFYVVTAVAEGTFEESVPGYGAGSGVITGATNTDPVVITSTAHGMSNGEKVYITGVGGMTEINNRIFTLTGVTANTFSLRTGETSATNVDGTGYGVYTSGGSWNEYGVRVTSAALSSTNTISLSWDTVDGAQEYNIYKEVNSSGVYGFIGISNSGVFIDRNIEADGADSPTIPRNPFNSASDYPATVTYIQQRRAFANTINNPEKVYLSRIGNFTNFTTRSPIQDDDSVTFQLAGRQVNAVRHMLDVGKLVVFTQGGEWSVEGAGSGIITPSDISPRQSSSNGSSTLAPLVIGGNALYVQARGSVIRDLSFDDTVQGYRGNDLTIFSAHLFDKYTINDWTYQQIPHSIVWAVRDDGVLLGLTYVREHEMWAWHKHDFGDDLVENVVTIPSSNEDAAYVCVKRTIGATTKRYIEYFASRQVNEIEDSIFVDSSYTYDGRNTNLSHTMTLSGGTTWDYDELLTLTSSTGFFTSLMVGDQIHLTGSDGTLIRFTIDNYSSSTVVTGRPNKVVPVAMRSTAISDWSRAVDSVSGLWHLEGKQVSIFADGFVVANPNNDSYNTVTVSSGVVTLDKQYAVIHVGLPYISDIQTLDIDTAQGETIVDKSKLVNHVEIFVEESRGIWAGPKPPSDDSVDPKEGLVELKIRNDEAYDSPVELQTGVVDLNIKAEWNSNGRVFIRQIDPVPLSVLAVAPAGLFPFRGG